MSQTAVLTAVLTCQVEAHDHVVAIGSLLALLRCGRVERLRLVVTVEQLHMSEQATNETTAYSANGRHEVYDSCVETQQGSEAMASAACQPGRSGRRRSSEGPSACTWASQSTGSRPSRCRPAPAARCKSDVDGRSNDWTRARTGKTKEAVLVVNEMPGHEAGDGVVDAEAAHGHGREADHADAVGQLHERARQLRRVALADFIVEVAAKPHRNHSQVMDEAHARRD